MVFATEGANSSRFSDGLLEGLVARTKWAREIHVVLDNLSAHKTKESVLTKSSGQLTSGAWVGTRSLAIAVEVR
jgi:hypothetical protein